jgi:predicted CxxxxCH...CXXCH cytochrome family protein
MQLLQVDCSSSGDGSCVIYSITVDDLGTAGATDISSLDIHIDNDNNFGNGVLGTVSQVGFNGSSTEVVLTALSAAIRTVTNPTSKYIWITYDLAASADGKTVQSSVTAIDVESPDSGAAGSWNSNNFSVYSGPASTITSCAGCHKYPPEDGTARNVPLGAVVGDHQPHSAYVCATCHIAPATETAADFGHRNKLIEMAAHIGNTGGSYSRGASFAVSNNPTTGTCSNINCHSGTVTPQWGIGTTACNSCHNTPPSSGAHAKHYTAKGWANDSTNCTVCHPDNSTSHSNVTDGIKIVNGTLIPSGASPAITCNSTGTGCHNSKTTPAWNTSGITCTTCHAVGGAAAGDPNSGLHNTSVVMAHDNQFRNTPGEALPGTANCLSCHTSAPSSDHFDGTVQNSAVATYAWNTGKIPAGYNRAADACAATCHTDNATWNRAWTGVADVAWSYANNAATAPVCGNCHGSFFTGWNIIGATSHLNPDPDNDANPTTPDNPDTLATSKGSHSECSTCHAWGHSNYTTGNKHVNNTLEMNSTLNYSAGSCSINCHSGLTLTMDPNSGWPDASVVGDGVTCGGCHTGGATPGSASGAHAIHGATAASLAANPASIALCVSCHGNDGTGPSHNNGTVNFANVNYNAARNVVTGTCVTADCHNYDPNIASPTKDRSTAWNTTALACDDCHYYASGTTPTSAGNTAHGRPLSADHGNHFGTGGSFACADCHGTDPVAGDTSHINGVTSLADKATATQDEANVIVATWNDTTNSCANAACHNPSGTTYSATWQVSTVSCTLCHSMTNPGTGSHGQHMNAAATFGINTTTCNSCHADNTGNNRHRTGNINMLAGMNYTAGALDVLGTVGTCNTSTCHNNGTVAATAVVTPTWGTPSADCTICHGNPPATAKHAEHVNATYVSSGCVACHTAATATTHINGARNMDAAKVVYTAATQTCTNNCHIANTTGDWTAVGALACADCHGSGKVTSPAMDRGFPPNQGAHLAHTGNTAYVNAANCTNCHNDNSVTHSTLNNVVTSAVGTAASRITANPGNGSCTNTCHAAAQAGDWTGGMAAVTCVDCHSGSYIGGGANGPVSGLHNVTPSVSGQRHDQSVAGGCASCHTTVLAQSTHINGAFTGGNGQKTQMGLAAFYTQTADNTGTCATTACHVGNSDAWAHKWVSTANWYTTNTTACQGCHGDASGFNAGVDHRVRGPHTSGATYGCADCHVLEASTNNYTFTWATNDWGGTSHHGNSVIEVNTNGGYNTTTNLCTTCHTTVNGIHNFVDTGWNVANLLGDAVAGGSCSSCHGYPPVPGDGKTAQSVEGKGAHAKHVNHLLLRTGRTLDANNDTFTGATSTAICGVCHNVSSDGNHSTGGGTRQMAIPVSYQFGSSAPSYNGTAGLSSSVDPKSCSNVNCHFKETPIWSSVGGQ